MQLREAWRGLIDRLFARQAEQPPTSGSNFRQQRASGHDELLRQLAQSPETDILGVISPSGVGGAGNGPRGCPEEWTVQIRLSGWRPVGESLRGSEMIVRRNVSDRELKLLMAAMKPYEVVRVRARFAEQNIFGSPQALLISFLGKDGSDAELNVHALKLQEPVTFEDPQFGVFTLDRRVDWYAAKPDWGGNAVKLTIGMDELEEALKVARQLWAEQAEWQRRIAACAIKHLLDLKNDAWLGDGEAEVSEAEFLSRMELETVQVHSDGSFQFWHGDGELFAGHSITVSGNLTDGPTDAAIEG